MHNSGHESFQSRALEELEALRGTRKVAESSLTSPKSDAVISRAAAELAALQCQSGSLKRVAEEFDRSISSPTAQSFKSREAAELEALRGQVQNLSTRKLVDELYLNLGSSPAQFKSREGAELAALKETRARAAEAYTNGINKDSIESSKSPAEAELAALLEQSGGSLKEVAEAFECGIKNNAHASFQSRALEELEALRGSTKVAEFKYASPRSEQIISRPAAESSAFQMQIESPKIVTDEFDRGISCPTEMGFKSREVAALESSGGQSRNIDTIKVTEESNLAGSPAQQFKSREAAELATLKETRENAAEAYSTGLKNNSSESFRSPAEAELAALQEQNGGRLKRVADAFDCGMKSSGHESFQSRALEELEALRGAAKVAGFNLGASSPRSDLVNSRTVAELAALQGQSGSLRTVAEEFDRGFSSSTLENSREAAELASLQSGSGSLRRVAEETGRSILSATVEGFKSREAAELEALCGQGQNASIRKVTEGVYLRLASSPVQQFKSRDAVELEALKHTKVMGAEAYSAGLKSDGSESFRSLAKAELATMQEQHGGNLKHVAEAFDAGMKSSGHNAFQTRALEELEALRSLNSSTSKVSEFNLAVASPTSERRNSQAAAELASLQGRSGSLRRVAEEFNRGVSSPTVGFKSREAAELEALRGQGENVSTRKVTEEFDRGFSSPKVNHFKSREAAELAALQGSGLASEALSQCFRTPSPERFRSNAAAELAALKGSEQATSRQSVAEQFNRGMSRSSSERCKSKAADELAALAELQKKRKEEEEANQEMVITEVPTMPLLSDAELAKIAEEREEMKRELEELMWDQRSSQQMLKQRQSHTAAELSALQGKAKNKDPDLLQQFELSLAKQFSTSKVLSDGHP